MSIVPFLTFPHEGISTPVARATLRTLAMPFPEGQRPQEIVPFLWFCCVCAASGREDPVGILNDEENEKCSVCNHEQCDTCGLAWARKKEYIIYTKGGLYASPVYIDPSHWECLCGEWKTNTLDENSVIGGTHCANPRCLGKDANWPPLSLDTIVMNKYGQRLGTLDQSAMQAGGPWATQRRALGDPEAALIAGLRPLPFRTPTDLLPELWGEGEPAPPYHPRPPSPESKFQGLSRRQLNEISWLFHEYLEGYLKGIPFEARSSKGKEIDSAGAGGQREIGEEAISVTDSVEQPSPPDIQPS